MRTKMNIQPEFDFQPSNLKLTNEYYAKYEEISRILDDNPKVLDRVHKDLKEPLKYAAVENRDGAVFKYTSDTVLRMLVCQIVEGASLREIVIRIDDGNHLRWFVRIYNGPMMDFTTLDKLKNSIRSKTWKRLNEVLSRYAVEAGIISGQRLRLDTTAVESNIHWPTDSSLLWDTYRVLARLIEQARELNPPAVGARRLLKKKVKKLVTKISRQAAKKPGAESLKPLYKAVIRLVEGICEWSVLVGEQLERGIKKHRFDPVAEARARCIVEQMTHYRDLGKRVIEQATRRVLNSAAVPNDDKIFSIFEPHTELLKRGQAGQPIEFGHLIQIQQGPEKFITDYEVFKKKPIEYELLEPAIENHKSLFGEYPDTLAADKGYWENQTVTKKLSKKVEMVSIAKQGRRTDAQTARETDPAFRHAQRFRAGVEGSISYLKRILGLFRCYNKGWEHYACTVGTTVFAHNLLILARC